MKNGNEQNLQCAYTRMCKENPKNCTDGTETLEKETQPHINNSIDLLSKGRLASELLWWGRSCTHIENHSGWWRQQGVYCYSYKPTAYMLHWPDKLKYGGASLRKTNARNKERALRCWRLSMHQLGCLLVAASPVYQTAISKKKRKKKGNLSTQSKRFEQKKMQENCQLHQEWSSNTELRNCATKLIRFSAPFLRTKCS